MSLPPGVPVASPKERLLYVGIMLLFTLSVFLLSEPVEEFLLWALTSAPDLYESSRNWEAIP